MGGFGGVFLGGLAGGFSNGYSMGRRIKGDMDQNELAKESDRLNKKMEDSTTYKADQQGQGALAMPDQQTAENYAAYNNTIAAEDEATFGGGLSSAPKTSVKKEQSYTRADYYADMGRKASGLGFYDRADRYQQRAEQMEDRQFNRERTIAADQRATESHSMNMEKGQIDLDRAKAEEEGRKRMETFNTTLAGEYEAASKAGKPLSFSRVMEIALENKLSPQQIVSAYAGINGIDEAETGSILAARARAARDAASGGLDNMVKVYETNPLFNDGITLELKRGKDGKVTLLQGGNALVSDVSEQHAIGYLLKHVVDPYSAIEFDMSVRSNMLKDRKTQSEIDENKAQASNALAGASKTRAETVNLKAGGGDGKYKVEANEVSSALGKPAMDERGRPITDDYGMQKFIRDPAEEDRFYKWMNAQGLTDTNKALAMWKGGAGDANKPSAPAPNPNRKPLSHFAN